MNITWTGDRYPWNNPDKGWLCPRCGRGVSPHSNVCPCIQSPSYEPWHPPFVPWKPFEPWKPAEPTIPSPNPWINPWDTTPWNPDPNIPYPDWTVRPEFGPWYDSTKITC